MTNGSSKCADAFLWVIDRISLSHPADERRKSEGKGRPLAFGNPEHRLVKRHGGNADGMHSQANDHIELHLLLWEKDRHHCLS